MFSVPRIESLNISEDIVAIIDLPVFNFLSLIDTEFDY